MSGFAGKIRLKERMGEDIYFTQRERELIEALHQKMALWGGVEVARETDTERSNESNQHSKHES